MGILSGLKGLFSGGDAAPEQQKEDALEYKGFEIVPAPIKKGASSVLQRSLAKEKGKREKNTILFVQILSQVETNALKSQYEKPSFSLIS